MTEQRSNYLEGPGLVEFTRSRDWPGRVIYAKVWGGYSHNTNLPTSDVDYLLVYAAPRERILGLFPPPETVDGSVKFGPESH